ncbi:hypothetical protein NUW54_g13883 [Trametes sanguinea]|uniref:Uncharacterized protein n=1 Tax=Trametes sanguinea TaxID=158606 RepID=A0ACC1MHR5_9APHY|nr:hypothetical protein NUW54_g13883 [Trametes sanguinea]
MEPSKEDSPEADDEDRDTVNDDMDVPDLRGRRLLDVPRVPGPGSHSTGSVSSSSDGSPVDKLVAAMDEAARGRNRAQTPIQGNGLCDPELNSLMLPGEHIIFNTTVEPGGPKRRASRLLAMAVAPKKHKPRELVLTSQRLLCVKQKPGRAVQVRTELFVRASGGMRAMCEDMKVCPLRVGLCEESVWGCEMQAGSSAARTLRNDFVQSTLRESTIAARMVCGERRSLRLSAIEPSANVVRCRSTLISPIDVSSL